MPSLYCVTSHHKPGQGCLYYPHFIVEDSAVGHSVKKLRPDLNPVVLDSRVWAMELMASGVG